MSDTPGALIDARIRELDDWRGRTLAHVRALIHKADPEVEETWKWRGVPVWEHDGILCTCLLYTSPSPRDGLLSRMPSSA